MNIELVPHTYYFLARKTRIPRKSKIVRPDETNADLFYGEVMSVGTECKEVKKGDKVLYLPQNAISFEDPNDSTAEVHIVPESAVFAHYEIFDVEEELQKV
jgi:hypothetical protein